MNFPDAFALAGATLTAWARDFFLALPNLIVAIFVVLVFLLVGRLVHSGIVRSASRFAPNRRIIELVAITAQSAVVILGVTLALGILNLTGAVATLLGGLGLVGLALGFAFQDIAQNFIAGVLIAFQRPFRIGDLVETNEYFGVVEEITLRATVIRTLQGAHVQIPNATVYSNPLTNYMRTPTRRVDVTVGVSYGDDLRRARDVAIAAVEGTPYRQADRPVELFYTQFNDSSIDFTVRIWITESAQVKFLEAQSHAVVAIKEAFDANGITIPFPIRTVDFSDVGGKPVADAWPRSTRS